MFGDFDIDITGDGSRSVVHVYGDIDAKTSPQVRAVILNLFKERGQKRVIVDLKGAMRIDNSGASSLMAGFEVAQKRNAEFVLTGLN